MAAINEIVVYLVQTLLSLYLVVMLLRLVLQMSRADFYNPICQFVVKITNPVVVPLRRIIPGFGGVDMATILLAILLQIAGIVVLLLLNQLRLPNVLILFLWGSLGVIGMLINLYFFAILAMIILSWVAPGSQHPALALLYQITEPVLAPFRKLLPSMGGLDLSPILVFIIINILQIALRHAAAGVGLHPALVMGI